VNERRAAYRQAHREEEAWRTQVIAKAVQEYEESGKLTEFFKESLAHFMDLPKWNRRCIRTIMPAIWPAKSDWISTTSPTPPGMAPLRLVRSPL
jgi:hypothetical protein